MIVESSSNTNLIYTCLPFVPVQLGSVLALTSTDFLVFSVSIVYSISSGFHDFLCSVIFLLKLSSCGALNLSKSF